ncbi:MAG: 6-bladed beta-propeller [Tannerella sp.]|nr:6-bladed beta-propeller [Tannerella sp.]
MIVKIKNIFLCFPFLFFFDADIKNTSEDVPFMINFSQNIPGKYITDIVEDTKFIPLETSDEILIGISKVAYVSDKIIIMYNFRESSIFIFNYEGKIISNFNHRGPGPMEYSGIMGLTYDEVNKEIFVLDLIPRANVYSETGQYKRTLHFPENTKFKEIYNFDEKHLLAYDIYDIGINWNLSTEADKKAIYNKPYAFLSKTDGSITEYVNINLSQRISTLHGSEDKSSQTIRTFGFITCGIIKSGSDFLLTDIASDTTYLLSRNKKLTPLILRTPSVHDKNPQELISATFRTDNYILIRKWLNDSNDAKKFTDYVFDISDNLFYKVKDFNIVDLGEKITRFLYPYPDDCGCDYYDNGVIVNLWQAFDLKIMLEQGQLKGELKNIAMNINEEDNPVLVIIKIK